MNDQVKEKIKKCLKQYAEETGRPTGKGLFKCFNPGHDEKKASMQFKETYYKCYGCNNTYDIFNLYAIDHNLDVKEDFNRIKKELAIKYNIDYKTIDKEEVKEEPRREIKEEKKVDYTSYYKTCKKDVAETDYFLKRGLTEEIIEKYNLGYDKKTGYVVLPVSKSFYMLRDTKDLTEEERLKQKRPKHNIVKGAVKEVFNLDLLKEADFKSVVFITESILDALSIEAVKPGTKAIALNGTAKEKLIDELENLDFKGYIVLALDNDENLSGQRASKELKEALEKIGLRVKVLNELGRPKEDIYKGYKDLNEFLVNDAEALENLITQYNDTLESYLKSEALKILSKENAVNYLEAFNETIADAELRTPTKTGIERLDKALNGGLFKKNLVIIGAISGLGKTTLALQIADNIARNKEDVLIFSLEMSKEELIAKSISKLMYLKALERRYTALALSTREILKGEMLKEATNKEIQEQKEIYLEAYNDYKENIAPNIFITECNEQNEITIKEIEERIKRQIAITEKKPIVIVDYLQIIENKERGLTDIQATSKVVKDLKRLARKYKITILVISAFNRGANYTDTDYTSFRDTSTIEYTADVLITMQYSVLDKANDVGEERTSNEKLQKKIKKAVEEASRKDPYELTLKILKNRNGIKKNLAYVDFYGKYNYLNFREKDINGDKIED